MSRKTSSFSAGLAAALFLAAPVGQAQPAPAPDEPPADEDASLDLHRFRLEAVGGAGFGDASLSTGETVNTYGACAGLRAGYVLPFGGYAGLHFDHFFGQTSSYPIPLVALVEHHAAANFIGADFGYELALSPAIIRPQLAIGLGVLRRSVDCDPVAGSFDDVADQVCSSVSESNTDVALAAAPGLLIGVALSRFYAFTDVRYYLRDEADALGAFGGIGIAL